MASLSKKKKSTSASKRNAVKIQEVTPRAKKVPIKRAKKATKSSPQAMTEKKQRVSVASATKKLEGKVTIKNNIALGKPKVTTLKKRDTMNVSVPSPYRFPAIRNVSIATVSRALGVFFVGVGAYFSLVNLQYLNDTYITPEQGGVANVITATTNALDTTTHTENVTNPEIRMPDIDPLSDTVPIVVLMNNAKSVELFINKEGYSPSRLGNAKKEIDGQTWKYDFKTNALTDGTYILTAHAVTATQQEVVRTFSSKPVTLTIVNADDVTTEEDETSESDLEDVSTDNTEAETDTSFQIRTEETSTLHGKTVLSVTAARTDSVVLYAKNMDTLVEYTLGIPRFNSDEAVWQLTWDSTTVSDGTYRFVAKKTVENTKVESTPITRTVRNNDSDNEVVIEDTPPAVKPEVTYTFSKQEVFSEFVEVTIQAPHLTSAELYATPIKSLTPFFIGKTKQVSDTTWKYLWDTRHTPNGDYEFFVRTRNAYGTADSYRTRVAVRNEVTPKLTESQEEKMESVRAIEPHLVREVQPDGETILRSETPVVYIEPVHTFVEKLSTDDSDLDSLTQDSVKETLTEYRTSLDTLLTDYARALRTDDTVARDDIKNKIEMLRAEVAGDVPRITEGTPHTETVHMYLTRLTNSLTELTEKNEEVIKDRMGVHVMQDSDNDGLTDYDEIHIYKTNPYAADTDGDGFIDGIEVERGFDPLNNASEAYIAYESAKETGIVRDDILVIESLITLDTSEIEHESIPRARISGRGLPNSYVTLYIYSTPIVVTVKTDETGVWSYIFDKELENGEHEVYVGMTDNEGRIIAKSNPLPFVKTAEAFDAGVASVTESIEVAPPSLFDAKMLSLIASIAVVALGLVLILLGIFVSQRAQPPQVATT